MFAIGDRIRKVSGDCNIGATGVVTSFDRDGPDGYDTEIRCDVPVFFTISGRQFSQQAGYRIWCRSEQWVIDRYDGNEPCHWSECCWNTRRGFVKK